MTSSGSTLSVRIPADTIAVSSSETDMATPPKTPSSHDNIKAKPLSLELGETSPVSADASLYTPTPQTDSTMSDVEDELPTSSPDETLPRVNRSQKRFVATAKDPRALAAKEKSSYAKKRPVVEPYSRRTTKRVKGYELDLPYHSIKAINMPPRAGVVGNRVPPTPVEGTFPYGNTEDHQNSLILHWLDEEEHTYGQATTLHNKMFPEDAITDEALRRRHIRSLQRLSKKYGAKPVDQIGPVGKTILRRGKSRAPRLNGIVPAATNRAASEDTDAATSPSATTTSTRRISGKSSRRFTTPYTTLNSQRRADRSMDFNKACIVIWKDSLNMDFTTIRNKLETEQNWSLGLNTIEKYYYQTLDRVYGMGSTERQVGEAAEAQDAGEHGVADTTPEVENAEE